MPVRVLIVDDLEAFRRAARAVVSAAVGFEVAGEAVDGEASLEAVKTLEPDVVLMDVNLPGMSGTEATRRILGSSPQVTVALLSTRDAEEFAGLAEECGAAAYLPKSRLSPRVLTQLLAPR